VVTGRSDLCTHGWARSVHSPSYPKEEHKVKQQKMIRRDLLKTAAMATAAFGIGRTLAPMPMSALAATRPVSAELDGGDGVPTGYQNRIREYLARFVRTRQEIDDWIAGRAFPFAKYDSELGFLHRDRRFKEGTAGSICTYTVVLAPTLMINPAHAIPSCTLIGLAVLTPTETVSLVVNR
jgi:hypothetical protein